MIIKSILILAAVIDGLAATVNTDSILKSEVVQEMAMRGVQLNEENYQATLNDLIDAKLILSAAARSKMTMQEWVVETRVQEIIKRSFDGDRNRLMADLAKDHVAYSEWHKRIRNDMIISSMRYQTIDKHVVATPAAIKAEYTEHPDKYSTAGEGKVSVTVWLRSNKSGKERMDEYKDIVPETLLQPEVCNVIRVTPLGETSDWCPYQGFMFKVRKDAEDVTKNVLPLNECFTLVEAEVKRQKGQELYKEWLDTLRKEAYIKVY